MAFPKMFYLPVSKQAFSKMPVVAAVVVPF
jgi:hypothetical protein